MPETNTPLSEKAAAELQRTSRDMFRIDMARALDQGVARARIDGINYDPAGYLADKKRAVVERATREEPLAAFVQAQIDAARREVAQRGELTVATQPRDRGIER